MMIGKTRRPKAKSSGKKRKNPENQAPIDFAIFERNVGSITPMRPPAPAPAPFLRVSDSDSSAPVDYVPVSRSRALLGRNRFSPDICSQLEDRYASSKRRRRHHHKAKHHDRSRDRDRDQDRGSHSQHRIVQEKVNSIASSSNSSGVDNDANANIATEDGVCSQEIIEAEADGTESASVTLQPQTPHHHHHRQSHEIENQNHNPTQSIDEEIIANTFQDIISAIQSPNLRPFDSNLNPPSVPAQSQYPPTNGVKPLLIKGVQLLHGMNERQTTDNKLICKLLEQHNINFLKQHKDMVSLHTDINRQIKSTEENATKHIEAVHQSLFDKIQVSESRLHQLEQSKGNTEQSLQALKEHSEITTSQYRILKEAQDEQLKQMNILSKQLGKIIQRGDSGGDHTNSAIPAAVPQTVPQKKLCPHCHQGFSKTYIAAHIRKHCKYAPAEANAT